MLKIFFLLDNYVFRSCLNSTYEIIEFFRFQANQPSLNVNDSNYTALYGKFKTQAIRIKVCHHCFVSRVSLFQIRESSGEISSTLWRTHYTALSFLFIKILCTSQLSFFNRTANKFFPSFFATRNSWAKRFWLKSFIF